MPVYHPFFLRLIDHDLLNRKGSASPLTVGWAPTRPLGPPLMPTIITAPKIQRSIAQPPY